MWKDLGGKGSGSEEKVDRAGNSQATQVTECSGSNVSGSEVEGKANFCKPCLAVPLRPKTPFLVFSDLSPDRHPGKVASPGAPVRARVAFNRNPIS